MTSKTSELSAGVEILIARLESHPEEFFGAVREARTFHETEAPKFSMWKAVIEDDLAAPRGSPREATRHTWFMTDAEKTALLDAYRKACRRRFDSEVVATLYEKPEHVPMPSTRVVYRATDPAMRLDSNGGFGIGVNHTYAGVR